MAIKCDYCNEESAGVRQESEFETVATGDIIPPIRIGMPNRVKKFKICMNPKCDKFEVKIEIS